MTVAAGSCRRPASCAPPKPRHWSSPVAKPRTLPPAPNASPKPTPCLPPTPPSFLWPDHCVQGTPGAQFHPDLELDRAELIIRKGYHRDIDSYSAFFENDRQTPTGLAGYLRERGLTRLFIVGLATDFCVAYSALDACRLGFEVTVIETACRGIDIDGSLDASWEQMKEAGVIRA